MRESKISRSIRRNVEIVKVTPLYIAYQLKNNRSVKILLQYMAEIDFNASNNFSKILPNLIEFSGFADYLYALPFSTIQMQQKQTLRVKEKDLEEIIKIKSSVTSYIDSSYYQNFMKEYRKGD
jgi:hypothetical protein